jgi:hypothetical protein
MASGVDLMDVVKSQIYIFLENLTLTVLVQREYNPPTKNTHEHRGHLAIYATKQKTAVSSPDNVNT